MWKFSKNSQTLTVGNFYYVYEKHVDTDFKDSDWVLFFWEFFIIILHKTIILAEFGCFRTALLAANGLVIEVTDRVFLLLF